MYIEPSKITDITFFAIITFVCVSFYVYGRYCWYKGREVGREEGRRLHRAEKKA